MNHSNRIFTHKVLRTIADSIIKFFLPLYILKQTNSLELSIVYLICQSLCTLIFINIFKKLYKKYTLILIILSCFPIIVCQAILSYFQINIITCIIASILMALNVSLYNISLNTLFAILDENTNVGKFQIAANVGKLVFMLISGLILAQIPQSFVYLSLISSIIYLTSILPLIKSYKVLNEKLKFNTRSKIKGLNKLTHFNKTNINFIGKYSYTHCKKESGLTLDKTTLWLNIYHIAFGIIYVLINDIVPLFLFVNNLNFEAVTIFLVLIELCNIFANALCKLFIKKKLFIICFIINFSLMLIGLTTLIFCNNALTLFIISTIIGISYPFTFVSMFYIVCKNSSKHIDKTIAMLNRDIIIFSGRPLYFSSYFIVHSLYANILFGFIFTLILFVSEVYAAKYFNSKKL